MKKITAAAITVALFSSFMSLANAAGVVSMAPADEASAAVRIEIAEKVKADDSVGKGVLDSRGFVYYAVAPMSNIKRTALTYPDDGKYEGTLQITAAQGEFEPASVVLFANKDLENVNVTVSDLKSKTGAAISAGNVDVKLIKIWYQTGCAWYSYFADTNGRVLVPELLVNDENFVRVDVEGKNNYVREILPDQSASYICVSSPIDYNVPVHGHRENILDAKTFQPFTLAKSEFKQLWFTVEVPADTPAGLYNGTIRVKAQAGGTAEIPLQVRVLPFQLPTPMTNYDITREYYTSSYNDNSLAIYLRENGGDVKRAENRLRNEYISYRKHNLMQPMVALNGDLATYLRNLEIYREAGLDTKVLFDGVLAVPPHTYLTHPDRQKPVAEQSLPEGWESRLEVFNSIKKLFGNDVEFYCLGWDEPSAELLKGERAPWRYLHQNGMKIYSTVLGNIHLKYAGYNEDFVTVGGSYSVDAARIWHSFGARITSYASPHTGPENPDFVRRTHGMDLYLADHDGSNNYKVAGGEWNDFSGATYNYRSFNWVYPAADGHVDTIQFEAFREGIDDVKYATLLRQYANRAVESNDVDTRYKGKAALQWLIQVNSKACDLNTLRLEMINKILELKSLLK